MDIWEANSRAQSIAPHTCNKTGPYLCKPDECAFEGVCDKWGCTYNTYNLGNPEYYGRGPQFAVDTTKPFTVVTQFPATADGKLAAVRRLYIQNGKVIGNAEVNRDIGLAAGVTKDQLDDEYCTKTSARRYLELGATAGMGDALSRGMVLIFSVWWDEGGGMDWLDGGNSGPCNKTEGFPSTIRQVEKFPKVTFSNVRWGEIGSTFKS